MEISKKTPNINDDGTSKSHFKIGNCVLVKDDSTSEVRLPSGKSMTLTHPESAILLCLYQSVGNVVTKHDLLVAGWGRPDIIGPNSLPVAMTNIRKVLNLAEIEIINIPRVGYKLEVPVKENKSPTTAEHRSKPFMIGNIHEVISFTLSIAVIIFISVILIFTSIAWVGVECKNVDDASFCYNERNQLEVLSSIDSVVPGDGRKLYFNNSGEWVEVKKYD